MRTVQAFKTANTRSIGVLLVAELPPLTDEQREKVYADDARRLAAALHATLPSGTLDRLAESLSVLAGGEKPW